MTRTRNRIIVGVDDSEASRITVEAAAAEAVLRTCPLHVIHADPFGAAARRQRATRRAGLRPVDAVARARAAAPGITVTGELARGFPQPVLIDASREAKLVVVWSDTGHIGILFPGPDARVRPPDHAGTSLSRTEGGTAPARALRSRPTAASATHLAWRDRAERPWLRDIVRSRLDKRACPLLPRE